MRKHSLPEWILAACFTMFFGPCVAVAMPPVNAEAPKPILRIPVDPLGFVPPGRLFMPYRVPSATLDFLDSTHLLFTFHAAKLMRREADEPKDDQDQIVRAVVLDLPSGKVQAEGTWRLHDKNRYLWNLGGGHFLLRQRDTLFLGDHNLALTVYLHPEGTFVSGQLSPDAGTLIVEYANREETPQLGDNRRAGAPTLGPSANKNGGSANDAITEFPEKPVSYTLLAINTRERSAERLGRVRQPLVLPLVKGGYLGVIADKGKQWKVGRSAFGGKPEEVVTLTSSCQPTLVALSEEAFLAQTCLPYISDHLVQAYDLQGHKLWEQLWQSRFTWGTLAYSAAGNRFAYGSIEVNHNLAVLDPVDDTSIMGQPVGVFGTATGKVEAVLDANPVFTAGNNFSLSPDGDRLAILRNGAIELYALPPLAAPSGTTPGAH